MMRMGVGNAGEGREQVSVEFPAWGEHRGVANEHFFALDKTACVHGDAALCMVDVGDFNLCQYHVTGAHRG